VIDLHVHSTASDGSDPPADIPRLAAEAGVTAVALTDHDIVDGLADAAVAAEAVGVRLVRGCELSCEVEAGTMHLLALFLDGDDGPLQARLAGLRDGRSGRNERIVEVLRANGMDVSLEEILEEAGGGTVGRPHIAAVLLRHGYVASIQEAFDLWLAKGRPAYADRDRLSPEEAVDLTRRSGAVAVLAHPLSLDRTPDDLEAFVAHLAALGLDGMEVEYGRYAPDERAGLRALADRHGLCPSGGSDYHGTYKPDLSIGTGRGDLDVPDEWLDALEARRPSGG
jgi:predicted metal-dependent phosphoesterase TrpH